MLRLNLGTRLWFRPSDRAQWFILLNAMETQSESPWLWVISVPLPQGPKIQELPVVDFRHVSDLNRLLTHSHWLTVFGPGSIGCDDWYVWSSIIEQAMMLEPPKGGGQLGYLRQVWQETGWGEATEPSEKPFNCSELQYLLLQNRKIIALTPEVSWDDSMP